MKKNIAVDKKIEFVEEAKAIHINRLTQNKVLKYFLVNNMRRALFVVDDVGKLVGIITIGDFLKHSEAVVEAIRKQCIYIENAPISKMLLEAEKIYMDFAICSEIPVINEEKLLLGYMIDRKIFEDRVDAGYERLQLAKEKILFFRKSFYLKKEIDAFYKMIKKAFIYARDNNISHEILEMFGNNINIKYLSDEEYVEKQVLLYQKRKKMSDGEKTELLFNFETGNESELSGIIGNASYTLERFISELTALVESENISRIVRIVEEPSKDFQKYIIKNNRQDVAIESNRLWTKYVYDYVQADGAFDVVLICQDELTAILENGMLNGRKCTLLIWWIDLYDMFCQQCLMNESFFAEKISVFYMYGLPNVTVTRGEKERFKSSATKEKLIRQGDEKTLRRLYGNNPGGRKTMEYVQELCYPYPTKRRFENDIMVNTDYSSTYINIENGFRKTCFQPEKYINTIYITGACTTLGVNVEDKHTIPSQLSKLCAENGYCYRIVNLGMLEGYNICSLPETLTLKDGDIIVHIIPEGKVDYPANVIDPSEAFDTISDREEIFFDNTAHCNHRGNYIYAKVLYKNIRHILKKESAFTELNKNNIYDVFKININDFSAYDMDQYLEQLETEKYKIPDMPKKIGSIVMNCNPFTLGHRYLVEYASENCDYLFIFVVEEEKSFFRFEDRIQMVRNGCRDIEHVSIVPSGKMIGSHLTFPEYFQRELSRDVVYGDREIIVNPATDVLLFARYVAPILGITRRFAAEEPLDSVTEQYNRCMERIFPFFNIEFVEIQRKALSNGRIVSASTVRKWYRKREFEKMKEMLPETTFEYLVEKADRYL